MNLFMLVEEHKNAELFSILTKDDINNTTRSGVSLLHSAVAARTSNVEAARKLISMGIDLSLRDDRGQTALHYAAYYGNAEIAEEILKHHGDLHVKDKYGNAPLWYAVFNAQDDYRTVALLLAYGADPNDKNHAGRSPLGFAKQIGDEELVGILTGNR